MKLANVFLTTIALMIISISQRAMAQNCGSFNGSDGYVSTDTTSVLNTNTVTMEAWIKPTNSSAEHEASCLYNADHSRGLEIATYSSGNTRFSACLGGTWHDLEITVSTVNVFDGSWHHVAGIVDGNSMAFYIDGDLRATYTGTGSNYLDYGSNVYCLVGKHPTAGLYYQGQVDELRVSNLVRYSGSTYTVPSSQFTTDANTLLLYHLNESSGTTTADSSGNGITGTLNGGVTFAASNAVVRGTVWSKNDGTITFTKPDHGNYSYADCQDRISDSVWLTRANWKGIFNIKTEGDYDAKNYTSPKGTEWARGTTANIGGLTFAKWKDGIDINPHDIVGIDLVLHLIAEDIYLDIKFLSWTGDANGGGFSYVRAARPLEVMPLAPTSYTGTTITLNGKVRSANSHAVAYFLYGTASGVYTDSVQAIPDTIIGTAETAIHADLAGLNSSTDYYYRISVRNDSTYKRSSESMFGPAKVWRATDGTVTFTKADYSDTKIPMNQDRITDDVWLTRGIREGLFNKKTETMYDGNTYTSPSGTEWAFGTTANLGTLTFKWWRSTIDRHPLDSINRDMVVHLISDDIYLDIKFLSWTQHGTGGGFSYVRAAGPLEVIPTKRTAYTGTSVTINGKVFSSGLSADAYVLYGTSSGTYTDSVQMTPTSISANTETTVSAELSGLNASATYYYCISTKNTNLYRRTGEHSFGKKNTLSASNGTITFTKSNYADPTNQINQDRINEDVWLTRETSQGIFNIKTQTSFGKGNFTSPAGTEWAFGTVAGIDTLQFHNWEDLVKGNVPSIVNKDMVVHLLTADIYLDLKFTSWTQHDNGGGFSLTRAGGALEIAPREASNVRATSATANAKLFTLGSSAGAYVLYGTSAGVYTDSIQATPTSVSPGTQTDISGTITGLTASTTYHYCVAAANVSLYKRTDDASFTTSSEFWIATPTAASLSKLREKITDTVYSYASTAGAYILYGSTTGGYTDSVQMTPNTIPMDSIVAANGTITGLTKGNTYYYCVAVTTTSSYTRTSEHRFTVFKVYASGDGTITFTKPDSADYTNAAYQDRITSDVWITRANDRGLFNIKSESTYERGTSPGGTEWAEGTTADVQNLSFNNWENAVHSNPHNAVGKDYVIHIVGNDTYYDIKLLSWRSGEETSGGKGGGFSYVRASSPLNIAIMPATNIKSDSATVNATIFSLASPATAYALYGTVNGTFSDSVRVTPNTIPTASETSVSAVLSGLTQETKYYYRIAASNSETYERSEVDSLTTQFAPVADATTPASNIASTSTQGKSINLHWTNGNGAGRIVVVDTTNPFGAIPTDYTNYTANATYGSGSQINNGFVVYDGTADSVKVTGLRGLTNYTFAVLEYTANGTHKNYLTSPLASATIKTADTTAPDMAGPGYALNLDGWHAVVVVNDDNSLDLVTSYTIEAWVKIATLKYAGIVSKYHTPGSNGYLLRLKYADPHDQFEFDQLTGGPTLVTDRWYHVAAVKDGDTRRLYVDGVEYASLSGSATNVQANSNELRIGEDYDADYNRFFEGNIDEVRIWNVALTATTIRDGMCKKITNAHPNWSNLKGYWRFNEESSDGSALDHSGNSNNGTLQSGATRVWSGASIGNESAYDYAGTNPSDFSAALSHTDGDQFTATGDGGTVEGIQVYRADGTSMRTDAVKPNENWSMDKDRYWGVFITGASPTYAATYSYNGRPGITNESDLGLARRANQADNNWSDVLATLNTGNKTLAESGQSNGEYTLGSKTGNNPLSVELASFTATASKSGAALAWKTATEMNNYGFEIERRAVDSKQPTVSTWQKIGFVQGAGTSNVPHEYSFADKNLSSGRYAYRLKHLDLDGLFKYSQETEVTIAVPKVFALNQNYPNPFNPSTVITYELPVTSVVRLSVFDLLGREVAALVNEEKPAGEYQVPWNAAKFPSGVYFYRLSAKSFSETKKLLLLR